MFDIQVEKKDLKAALDCIAATVGESNPNFGDDCVSLTDLGTGVLELYTTNNGIEYSRVSIILSSGSSAGKPVKMPFVNFKRFRQIIESIPEGEFISIKVPASDIEISYGTRKKPIKLTTFAGNMIALPNVSGNTLTYSKNIIQNGLNNASIIVKDNGTNALTNCMRIYGNDFNVEVTAVDVKNSRMMLYTGQNVEKNFGEVLLEVHKFKKVFKMFNDFDELCFEVSPSFVKVSGNNSSNTVSKSLVEAEYYARALSGAYPNNIAPMFSNVAEFARVNKAEIESSLARSSAIEDTTIGTDAMDLSIASNTVNVVKSSQYGVVEDSFDTETETTVNIRNSFRVKPFMEVMKAFPDKDQNGNDVDIEIGEVAVSSTGHYIIRNSKNYDCQFLITGLYSGQGTP